MTPALDNERLDYATLHQGYACFPSGHGDKRCVLPIGKDVILNADRCELLVPGK